MQTSTSADHLPSTRQSQLDCPVRFTQADLYNYLYRQHQATPLTEQDLIKDTSLAVYWCSICKKVYQSLCMLHGSEHCKAQQTVLSTAIKSFPNEVQICLSSLPGTVFGVITRCYIPKGTWLGPYEGTKVRPDRVLLGTDHSFMWEIYKQGQLAYYLDGSNEDTSSWMRFIACARNTSEQNLYAFQYCGNIYYRAFKEIPPGTELLVWYDDIYPQFMGIPLEISETEGIYQRAADPNAKQDQVVVVVTDQHQPCLTAMPNYQIAAAPITTNPVIAKQHQGHHINLPRLPEPQSSQLLIRRRQNTRSSSTSTKVKLDNQLPRQQSTPAIDNQLPRQPSTSLLEEDPSDVQNRKLTHSESSDAVDRESDQSSPGQESNAFKCGQCGKTFPQRSVLQIHVCPKQPYKPYHCGHCNRLFDDPNELRNHAMMHTNEKPFKCGYCSRSFSGATTLNNHIRTHTGEKPFECQVCGKTFSQASQLSRHEKIPGDCVEQ